MTWNSDLTPEERERNSKIWEKYAERFSPRAIPPGGDFYDTAQWSWLRNRTIMKYGNRCLKCGTDNSSENPIQVDHVKPRSKYPELQWNESNLQVLCKNCNKEKGNKTEEDWRPQ